MLTPVFWNMTPCTLVDCVWNVMAHAQKPDLVFRRKGRVNLNRRGRQFSRLLAAEVCASAVVMVRGSVKRCEGYWLPTPFASFPFTSPPVRHRVPSGFNWTLHRYPKGIPKDQLPASIFSVVTRTIAEHRNVRTCISLRLSCWRRQQAHSKSW